jgi:hypothetical protein
LLYVLMFMYIICILVIPISNYVMYVFGGT